MIPIKGNASVIDRTKKVAIGPKAAWVSDGNDVDLVSDKSFAYYCQTVFDWIYITEANLDEMNYELGERIGVLKKSELDEAKTQELSEAKSKEYRLRKQIIDFSFQTGRIKRLEESGGFKDRR